MKKVAVYVMYKTSVLDPQGEAIKGAVHRMGYDTVNDIRMGKYFEIQVSGSEEQIINTIEAVCDKLLANVVMENYRYHIIEEEI